MTEPVVSIDGPNTITPTVPEPTAFDIRTILRDLVVKDLLGPDAKWPVWMLPSSFGLSIMVEESVPEIVVSAR